MSYSIFPRFRQIALFCLLVTTSAMMWAQTQASCSFNIFQLPSDQDQVYGSNDYKTVVGKAVFSSNPVEKGFIRYSNGSVSYYLVPNSFVSYFTWRNNNGTNIGVYTTPNADTVAKGFMLSGSTFTSIVHPNSVWGTNLTGINKYNSIVGWYLDSNENVHGFKRYSNGSFTALNYPASNGGNTTPNGINDAGTIVGSYDGGGFIYHSGSWATLNYPEGTTQLKGVSNAGVIVGVSSATEQGVSFLYANGTFKVINVANSFSTAVSGISADGLISGMTNLNGNQTGWRGFTATCH